jgi:predicted transcriptional regulator
MGFTAQRDLLLSIRPTHVQNIAKGRKTVELRRRFSENAEGATVLIYSTSPTRAIVGWATISAVVHLPLKVLWDKYGEAACVDRETFSTYFRGLKKGYAISLVNVHFFARAVEATHLKEKFGFVPPQSFMYLRQEYYHLLKHEHVKAPDRHERFHRARRSEAS